MEESSARGWLVRGRARARHAGARTGRPRLLAMAVAAVVRERRRHAEWRAGAGGETGCCAQGRPLYHAASVASHRIASHRIASHHIASHRIDPHTQQRLVAYTCNNLAALHCDAIMYYVFTTLILQLPTRSSLSKVPN